MKRRLLLSLLLTAALLLSVPTMWSSVRSAPRVSELLRPAEQRTLMLWLISDDTGSLRLLKTLCADFERANAGVRVYLRKADASELTAPDAVLPDAVLFSVGDLSEPQRCFRVVADDCGVRSDALAAGAYRLAQYAVPLWVSPTVLAVPNAWAERPAPTARPTSASPFGLGTPLPQATPAPSESAAEAPVIPWPRVAAAVAMPDCPADVFQLMAACPLEQRGELRETLGRWETAFLRKASPKPSRKGLGDGEGGGERLTAYAANADGEAARVMTLSDYRKARQNGQELSGFALSPAFYGRALFFGACGESDDVSRLRAFLLASPKLAENDLLPMVGDALPDVSDLDGMAELLRGALVLPNAFAHGRAELQALALAAMRDGSDPVTQILRLR